MRIEDLMTRDPECCTPHHDLAHAAMIMWRRDCGIVPVVEGGTQTLIGIITDRDICMAATMKGRAPGAIPVADVMNRKPMTCLPDEDVKSALRKMGDAQVRRLPVADAAGNVRGILALNDLVLRLERADGKGGEDSIPHSDVMGMLRSISKHRASATLAAR
jgi:CBS domain-containing protein